MVPVPKNTLIHQQYQPSPDRAHPCFLLLRHKWNPKQIICSLFDSELPHTIRKEEQKNSQHRPSGSVSLLYCPPVQFFSRLPVITPSAFCSRVWEACITPHLWPVGVCSEGLESVSPGAWITPNWWFGGKDQEFAVGLEVWGKIREVP